MGAALDSASDRVGGVIDKVDSGVVAPVQDAAPSIIGNYVLGNAFGGAAGLSGGGFGSDISAESLGNSSDQFWQTVGDPEAISAAGGGAATGLNDLDKFDYPEKYAGTKTYVPTGFTNPLNDVKLSDVRSAASIANSVAGVLGAGALAKAANTSPIAPASRPALIDAAPAEIPTMNSPQVDEAAINQKKKAAIAGGVMANIKTSPQGVLTPANVTGKQLLGR